MTALHEIKKIRAHIRSSGNIALIRAEKSQQYKNARANTVAALQKQLADILSPEFLASLTGMVAPKIEKSDIEKKAVEDLLYTLITKELKGKELSKYISYYSYLKFTGEIGGTVALEKLGAIIKFDIKDERLIKQLKDAELELVKNVDESTKKWMAKTISKELNKGTSIKDIASIISQKYKSISLNRAELIVSNEAANAAAIVERRTYTENLISEWFWQTNNDGRVTLGCLSNQAAGTRKIGEPFPSGNTQNPRFPGCRCWMEPVIVSVLPARWWTGG